MSDPEIARRCPTCGASIREVALFCPQCGNAQPNSQTGEAPEITSKSTAPLDEADVESSQKSMADTIAITRHKETPAAASDKQTMSETVGVERPEKKGQRPAGPGVRKAVGAVGAKVQRATSIARGVEGDVIHRVQKVRQMSHVVLDEAGDDPGLRFVLVAAIVFVLFLIIVLLNKLIT
jgi:uncharacterized Zn finger protein (UPF0148 family)